MSHQSPQRAIAADARCDRCHKGEALLKSIQVTNEHHVVVADHLLCLVCIPLFDHDLSASYPEHQRQYSIHGAGADQLQASLSQRDSVQISIERPHDPVRSDSDIPMVEALCDAIMLAQSGQMPLPPYPTPMLRTTRVIEVPSKPGGFYDGEPVKHVPGVHSAQLKYWVLGHDLYTALMMSGGLISVDFTTMPNEPEPEEDLA